MVVSAIRDGVPRGVAVGWERKQMEKKNRFLGKVGRDEEMEDLS